VIKYRVITFIPKISIKHNLQLRVSCDTREGKGRTDRREAWGREGRR